MFDDVVVVIIIVVIVFIIAGRYNSAKAGFLWKSKNREH